MLTYPRTSSRLRRWQRNYILIRAFDPWKEALSVPAEILKRETIVIPAWN